MAGGVWGASAYSSSASLSTNSSCGSSSSAAFRYRLCWASGGLPDVLATMLATPASTEVHHMPQLSPRCCTELGHSISWARAVQHGFVGPELQALKHFARVLHRYSVGCRGHLTHTVTCTDSASVQRHKQGSRSECVSSTLLLSNGDVLEHWKVLLLSWHVENLGDARNDASRCAKLLSPAAAIVSRTRKACVSLASMQPVALCPSPRNCRNRWSDIGSAAGW